MRPELIVIETSPGETRIALLDRNEDLVELILDRPYTTGASLVGAVFAGRVTAIDRDLNAAFVEIGSETPGYLGFNDAKRAGTADQDAKSMKYLLSEGEHVLVQVDRDGIGSKGARLTRRIGLSGRFATLRPGNRGLRFSRFLTRTDRAKLSALEDIVTHGLELSFAPSVGGVEVDKVVSELIELINHLQSLEAEPPSAVGQLAAPPSPVQRALSLSAPNVTVVTDSVDVAAEVQALAPDLDVAKPPSSKPLFEEFAIEEQIEAALSPVVNLPKGGRLIFTEAPALTAIDVDTGDKQSGSPGKLARDVNLAAVKRVAIELRRRGIAGQILIDVVPMKGKKDRADVLGQLKQSLESDPNECHVMGYTGLGLIEMTRRRTGPSLAQQLLKSIERQDSPETEALSALRQVVIARGTTPRIEVSPDAVRLLQGNLAAALTEAETALGVTIDMKVRA